MIFLCYKCLEKISSVDIIIDHLKKKHLIKDNMQKIKCIVNNPNCEKEYSSYSALRKHVKKCISAINQTIEKGLNISVTILR